MNKVKNNAYILLIFCTMFWGGNAVAGKYLAGSIPPVTISFMRLAISLLIILPILYPLFKREAPAARKNIKLLLILAITGVIGYNLFSYWAVNYTSAINSSLLNSTGPLLIFMLSYIVTGEKITKKFALSILLSLSGVMIVITRGSFERLVTFQFNAGDLIMLLAVTMWAVYSILLKSASHKMDIITIFGYSLLIGFALMIPGTLIELSVIPIEKLGSTEWIALLYLGIFPSIFSFLLWNRAIALIGPSRSSIFMNLTPVFAALIAFFVLGEVITVPQILGGILVFIGVFYSSIKKKEYTPENVLLRIK
ncbi:DMT family transporter [Domibacillus iocasae]|nr:DMT family transporter [Domibacillus iocasae]